MINSIARSVFYRTMNGIDCIHLDNLYCTIKYHFVPLNGLNTMIHKDRKILTSETLSLMNAYYDFERLRSLVPLYSSDPFA